MTFDEYQKKALTTLLKKEDYLHNLMQNVLGIGDESGEVMAVFKKWIRDDGADPAKLDGEKIKKELGDVLWYVAVIAELTGIKLSDIADLNISKLASRKQRGVLGGSGDNR